MAVKIVKQYEQGVLFRLGRVRRPKRPGLRLIVPFVDVLHRVSLRIVTMPIQSQGIITRDNVSVDVSAVAYFRVVDAVKSVVAIENVRAAIDQIAQTTLRKVVGQHTLDETLSETDRINLDIREILDVSTLDWGVEDTRGTEGHPAARVDEAGHGRQAEAEREKRAKIINAEGESMAAAALGQASGIMMDHPLALHCGPCEPGRRRRQEHHLVFPAPLMTTIAELGSFLTREAAASTASRHGRPSRSRSRNGARPTNAARPRLNPHDRTIGPSEHQACHAQREASHADLRSHRHNIDSSGKLTAYVEGEVAAALSRFSDHITRIEVHLSDESGGRASGADIRCMIQARPAGQTPVTVTDDAGSVDAALAGAIHRLNHLLESHEGRQEDQHARASIRGHMPR